MVDLYIRAADTKVTKQIRKRKLESKTTALKITACFHRRQNLTPEARRRRGSNTVNNQKKGGAPGPGPAFSQRRPSLSPEPPLIFQVIWVPLLPRDSAEGVHKKR